MVENQENMNHVEIKAEYRRLRSVAPEWSPALLRESVIDSFVAKWGMFKDEVAEIVDACLASSQDDTTASKKVFFSNIRWDTDGHTVASLPDFIELDINSDVDVDLEGADVLADRFGFCVKAFDWSNSEATADRPRA